MGRKHRRQPCGPPSGIHGGGDAWVYAPQCTQPATMKLSVMHERGSGSWHVCDLCAVRTALWLDDTYRDTVITKAPLP